MRTVEAVPHAVCLTRCLTIALTQPHVLCDCRLAVLCGSITMVWLRVPVDGGSAHTYGLRAPVATHAYGLVTVPVAAYVLHWYLYAFLHMVGVAV